MSEKNGKSLYDCAKAVAKEARKWPAWKRNFFGGKYKYKKLFPDQQQEDQS